MTTLTCCNIQVKQHYCAILATATGNCDVANVTYNENTYYVVTWTFMASPRCTCADASDYVRSLLCATLLVGSIAVQRKSLTSFITEASKPSLDLFPRKCTYAKVIDLRNMVLWSIGFIANRYRMPPTKLACVRYWPDVVYTTKIAGIIDRKKISLMPLRSRMKLCYSDYVTRNRLRSWCAVCK